MVIKLIGDTTYWYLWILLGMLIAISFIFFSLMIRDLIEKRFKRFVENIPEVKEEEFFK